MVNMTEIIKAIAISSASNQREGYAIRVDSSAFEENNKLLHFHF
jgi:hypothetical protein